MKILFVCKGNWFRSQIAQELYNQLTGTKDADSCGTYVGAINEPEGSKLGDLFGKEPAFIPYMKEQGIELAEKRTVKFKSEMMDRYDIIVNMAQEPFIPDVIKSSPKTIFWTVEDSDFVSREVAEDRYLKIKKLVESLIRGRF